MEFIPNINDKCTYMFNKFIATYFNVIQPQSLAKYFCLCVCAFACGN